MTNQFIFKNDLLVTPDADIRGVAAESGYGDARLLAKASTHLDQPVPAPA